VTYVLVVEDDTYIQLLIMRKLQSAGYTVRTMMNGQDALALALREPPSILLLDVMLPDISGLEVCQAIKTKLGAKSPPVIILSARGQISDVQAGKAVGADDYLIKPFAPRELLARVQRFARA
jgi:two-component system phosphate regulon response regulator PhoB